MPDRLYCSLAEILGDLDKHGVKDWKESEVFEKIRAASDFMDRKLGNFIPVTAAKTFSGLGDIDLQVDHLLAVTTIVNNGSTITSTQYNLYPRQRYWENGPYSRLRVDPDATELSVWYDEDGSVVITGRWGEYEETISTGATVQNTTAIAAGGTSLLVSNGKLISLGMVLLIGTEQMLVTAAEAATDSTATLAEALDNSEEEIDVSDGTLVNVGEIIKVDFEQMRVLDKKTNTLLVIRGWNGTSKVSHLTAAAVSVYRTYTVKRGINGTTDAAHLNGVAISRYIVPYDINYLARQIAALMMKKAESGFAGKTGSVELGEVFYNQEFPKDPIKEIKNNYRVVSL